MTEPVTVVLHFDSRGDPDLLVNGEPAIVYWIDDRAPDDRVYRTDARSSLAEINKLIGGSPIGDDGARRAKLRLVK